MLKFKVFIGFLVAAIGCSKASNAQKLNNVDFKTEKGKVFITYDFKKDGWRKCYNIKAYYSFKGSYEWYKIKNATGDIGACISSGSGKEIQWHVLKSGEGFVKPLEIKVIAEKKELDDHLLFWLYLDYNFFPSIEGVNKTFYSKNDLLSSSFSTKYGWFQQKKNLLGFLTAIQYYNASASLNKNLNGIDPFFNGLAVDFKIGPMFKLVNSNGFELILYGTTGLTVYSNYSVSLDRSNGYKFSNNEVYNQEKNFDYKGVTITQKNNPDKLILQGKKTLKDRQKFPFPLTCGILLSFDWLNIDLGVSIIELRGLKDFENDFNNLLDRTKVNKAVTYNERAIIGSVGVGFNF